MTDKRKPSGRLRGVSLGPGSPDLITVRGLNALRSSSVIYYPVATQKTVEKSSAKSSVPLETVATETVTTESVSQDAAHSGFAAETVPADSAAKPDGRCFSVLSHYGLAGKAKPFSVDMTDRRSAGRSYGSVRKRLLADLARGLDVAVVCEGCVSFYSTVFRILEAGISDADVPDTGVSDASVPDAGVFSGGFELVPGVSSPSAAAAAAGVCLGLGNGGFAVVAGGQLREMADAIERFETVVILKPAPAVFPFIRENGLDFVYCRNLGGEDELVTENPEDIAGENFPYFSLFIVSKRLIKCREP